jgi:hypothetical protein
LDIVDFVKKCTGNACKKGVTIEVGNLTFQIFSQKRQELFDLGIYFMFGDVVCGENGRVHLEASNAIGGSSRFDDSRPKKAMCAEYGKEKDGSNARLGGQHVFSL